MKSEAAWGIVGLAGGIVGNLTLPLFHAWSAPWLTVLAAANMAVFYGLWAVVRHHLNWRWLTQFRIESPIYRLKGWPHSANLAARVFHAQSFMDFSKLSSESIITGTIRLFNGSMQGVEVQRVTGFLWYDALSGQETVQVAWVGYGSTCKPLDTIDVAFEQRVPSGSVAALVQDIIDRKVILFSFRQLRIDLMGVETKELSQACLWHGVSCQTPDIPMVIGRVAESS